MCLEEALSCGPKFYWSITTIAGHKKLMLEKLLLCADGEREGLCRALTTL